MNPHLSPAPPSSSPRNPSRTHPHIKPLQKTIPLLQHPRHPTTKNPPPQPQKSSPQRKNQHPPLPQKAKSPPQTKLLLASPLPHRNQITPNKIVLQQKKPQLQKARSKLPRNPLCRKAQPRPQFRQHLNRKTLPSPRSPAPRNPSPPPPHRYHPPLQRQQHLTPGP